METHNSDWSSTVLDVDPRAMDGLDKLRSLGLASNNLWSLPAEFFCQVTLNTCTTERGVLSVARF